MNCDKNQPEPLWIMGVPLTPFGSYLQAVATVADIIARRRRAFCVALNPEKLFRAQRDPELKALLAQADLGICDGVGVALGTRLLYGRRVPRCTGVDLCLHLLAEAARRGWRVFLLGASEVSNAGAAAALKRRFPGLRIVGRRNGYFENDEEVVAQINACRPDLLFVAMGSPRQERWIVKHRTALEVPFCMGIGGTLDVAAGMVKRAPALCRRTGTEFLYRLLREPRRIKRQWVLPLFGLSVLWQALLGRSRLPAPVPVRRR